MTDTEIRQLSTDDLLAAVTGNAPGLAHRSGGDTEHGAARSVVSVSGPIRTAVLMALATAGTRGLTDLELEAALDLHRPSGGNRRGELVALGLVDPSSERRDSPSGRPCVVWKINDRGREVAAEVRARQP